MRWSRTPWALGLLLACGTAGLVARSGDARRDAAGQGSPPAVGDPAAKPTPPPTRDLHRVYDALLRRYVTREGVLYSAWASSPEDREALEAYVRRLQVVDTAPLARSDALAFWINLYNAVTLNLILDHYPIASIRDLPGTQSAWERKLVVVDGQHLSLNEIESGILRPVFTDPRIHFALNCAARSCPPLAAFAFEGTEIDAQLDAVTAAALNEPTFVDVSGCRDGSGTIHVTKIFEWYASDWQTPDLSVRSFIAGYRPADRHRLLDQRCELVYDDYDWALNDAGGAP
jgi:hypothetical protein